MNARNLSFYEGCSSQFVIAFPKSFRTARNPPTCMKFQKYGGGSKIRVPPSLVSAGVTFHMHEIPMDRWKTLILGTWNLSVLWIRVVEDLTFCFSPASRRAVSTTSLRTSH
jgi:hypothetical protein